MKKMKVLLMASVVAMFALCGCSEAEETKKEEKQEEVQTRVELTSIDDAVFVSYTDNTTTITLVDQEGLWYFEDDMETWVDQTKVYGIVEQISHLTSVDAVDDGKALADYGLETPAYKIVVKDAEGNEATISIGKTDENGYYYATIGDSSEVYLIGEQLPKVLEFDAKYLTVVSDELNEEIPEEEFIEDEIIEEEYEEDIPEDEFIESEE